VGMSDVCTNCNRAQNLGPKARINRDPARSQVSDWCPACNAEMFRQMRALSTHPVTYCRGCGYFAAVHGEHRDDCTPKTSTGNKAARRKGEINHEQTDPRPTYGRTPIHGSGS
jgi:hypothetical protein